MITHVDVCSSACQCALVLALRARYVQQGTCDNYGHSEDQEFRAHLLIEQWRRRIRCSQNHALPLKNSSSYRVNQVCTVLDCVLENVPLGERLSAGCHRELVRNFHPVRWECKGRMVALCRPWRLITASWRLVQRKDIRRSCRSPARVCEEVST